MSINVSENDPRVVEAILRADFYLFIQAIFPLVSPNSLLMCNWHLAGFLRRNRASTENSAAPENESNNRQNTPPSKETKP